MHPLGKVMTGVGAVILILCGILFAFGVSDVSEKVDDVNYVISNQNGGDAQVYDDDGFGDCGFTWKRYHATLVKHVPFTLI